MRANFFHYAKALEASGLRRRPFCFLPGWGFAGDVIALAGRNVPWFYPDGPVEPRTVVRDLKAYLDEQGIPRVDLVGWSMGANLACDFAHAYPEAVSSLYLLSMRRQWPADEIKEIRRELADDPAAFMRSFYRKSFLGHKEAYRRFTDGLQERYLAAVPAGLDRLDAGLSYLERFKLPAIEGPDVFSIHGRRDIVAPIDQMTAVAGAAVEILEHAGHAVFLAVDFAQKQQQRKRAIRARFSKAAATYDRHARLQQELAGELINGLTFLGSPPETILEIGCGTGNYTVRLAERFPAARLVAVDFSEAMINAARSKCAAFRQRLDFVCEDGEAFLAGAGRNFDLITANSTMQWFDDPGGALAAIQGLLTAQGYFWGAVFGPETLAELHEGLSRLFKQHIALPASRFRAKSEIASFLSCFSAVAIEEKRITRHYASLRELLLHIKKTGTAGWHPAPLALTKGRLARLEEWFQGRYGGFPATYQVFILRCRK